MADAKIKWKINRHAAFTSLRTYLVVITLFVLASINLFALPEGRVLYFPLAILMSAYIGLCLTALKLYRDSETWFITIEDDVIKIPRFGRKRLQLKLSNINSIQKYYFSKQIIGILVGQQARPSTMIERRIFYSENDFYRCVQLLENFTFENQKTEEKKIPVFMIKYKRDGWRADFLAVSMIFLYISLSADGIDKIDNEVIRYAGLNKHLFISGEYYRLFTSFSLHYSPFHLLPNVISLSIIGRHVITIVGPARFTNIVFFSAIFGALLSLAYSPYEFVLGASGGIFGLIGAHMYVCARFSGQLPGNVLISVKTFSCIFAVQMVFDLLGSGGDIYSHLGGGALGFLYALCVFNKRSLSEAAEPARSEIYISIILLASYFISLLYFIH